MVGIGQARVVPRGVSFPSRIRDGFLVEWSDRVQAGLEQAGRPRARARADRVWRERRTLARYLRRNETLRAALQLPRRAHHRQQPDGRPPRLGTHLQGPLPALPHHARRAAALPERLRLPGPLGRGRGRERARLQEQARHRGVRRSTASSSSARRGSTRSPASRPSRPCGSATWMDWDHTYFTNSDENNYTIWDFLEGCHARGLIYKGHDVMPWCPRCGTGISNMEIATEGYRELRHLSLTLRLPITSPGHDGEDLLVWTTTPWTLSSNVAAAVHPRLTYVRVEGADGRRSWVSRGSLARVMPRRPSSARRRARAGGAHLPRPVRRAADPGRAWSTASSPGTR